MFKDKHQLCSVGLTDIGKARSRNEDAIFVSDGLGLYLVADGMGGHADGDVASALAVEIISKHFADSPGGEAASSLSRAVREANRCVFDTSQKKTSPTTSFTFSGAVPEALMGTTLVALAVDGEEAVIAHVGDSRAYRFRNNHLQRLTRDHSLAESGPENGNPAVTLGPRFKNVITRALGIEADVEVEICREFLKRGDLFLLCSDGLTNMVSDSRIEAILAQSHTRESACKSLIDSANDSGGKDNISSVLVQYA
ncbi:MAG: protein phosphatase 2C domain-containing protein [Nitrospiria bacterium]